MKRLLILVFNASDFSACHNGKVSDGGGQIGAYPEKEDEISTEDLRDISKYLKAWKTY